MSRRYGCQVAGFRWRWLLIGLMAATTACSPVPGVAAVTALSATGPVPSRSPVSTAAASPPDSQPPDSQPSVAQPPDSQPPDSQPPNAEVLPVVGLAGVNEPACRSRLRPVILLHGTFSTVASNFRAMVPSLRASGRCVYGIDYGNGGVASVTASAGQFAHLVATVRQVTGDAEVDVIGYSQGGLVLRTALRFNGIADEVAAAVLLAPSWNGTTSSLAGSVPAGLCPACADQAAGSALLQRLNIGGDLDGAVRYAEISTRADTVVTPIGSQVPTGPAERVRSLVVEDRCPLLVTDHVRLPAVPGVIDWVVAALDTDGVPAPSALTC